MTSSTIILAVFIAVYAGMLIGRIPGLAVDRTGIALLGAVALLATGQVTLEQAWSAIDVPTMALLLGLMVVSAQLRLGGLYSAITRRIATAPWALNRPGLLLAGVIAASGVLAAVVVNDVICLAMAPLLAESCRRRGLNPIPILLGLACAANIGSAATLIGNPQNMLIGQTLGLSFRGYLLDSLLPSVLGCAAAWAIIMSSARGLWVRPAEDAEIHWRAFDRWQSLKGLLVLAAIVLLFLLTGLPREVVALAGAGVLLLSRRMHTREMLGLVDWQLLVLFAGLFIVNDALEQAGLAARGLEAATELGADLRHPAWLFGASVVLSQLVSNVPAVMLLLPAAPGSGVEGSAQAGAILALGSTLAGNMLIIGSIANIIVVDQAQRCGVKITWMQHAKAGVPVTMVSLAIAGLWLWLRYPG